MKAAILAVLIFGFVITRIPQHSGPAGRRAAKQSASALAPGKQVRARTGGTAESTKNKSSVEGRLATYTLLLVVVGFLQFLVLAFTVYVMYLQARFTEFSLQQWVDLSNWRLRGEKEGADEARHTVDFDITNNTRRPITLRRVTTQVLIMGMDDEPIDWEGEPSPERHSYEVSENLMLPPGGESHYTCSVPVLLRGKQIARFLTPGVFVAFSGEISFMNPRGRETEQRFSQVALLKPKKLLLYRPAGVVPKELD